MNIKNMLEGNISQEDLLNYYNATIDYINIPYHNIKGFVNCYNGVYLIAINKNLSYYKKKKTLLHELAHIELNHLYKCDADLFAFNVDNYEDEASEYIKQLIKE